jgi:uncharacterized membrane protein
LRQAAPPLTTAVLLGVAVVSIFVASPLIGRPPVVRVAPILLFALVALIAVLRPWKWSDVEWDRLGEWNPSARLVLVAAIVAGLILFWFVLTRFRSGEINAIDFTVYYDRPSYQTSQGRPMYVESADDPVRAYRTYFAVHADWVMLPLGAFYLVRPSPLWLLALSVVAVVAGAWYTLRIVRNAGGGGLLACASALAFLLNDNTARTLNYGFHPEVLYAWFIPWMIDAGLGRRWRAFALAALACIAVKEDAFLLMFAVAVLLVLAGGRRLARVERVYVAAPIVLAVVNLALYYRLLVPRLSPTGAPTYANYWANYGPTAMSAALGMLRRPADVLVSTLTSAFTTKVIVPHLYLPLVGWRWFIGIVPVVLLYGASDNEQLRSFGIYYAIVLVPFLVLGAAAGAQRCAGAFIRNRGRAAAMAGAAVMFGALAGGIADAGYSLRPWKAEIASVPGMLETLGEDRVVLVQSGLYPHAGYAPHVQLLTRDTLRDPRYAGAVLVLARRVSAYPLSADETAALYALPAIARSDSGLVAVARARPPRPTLPPAP